MRRRSRSDAVLRTAMPGHDEIRDSISNDNALVPRIRSSHDFARGTVANFGFKSGTRIIMLLVSFRFRSSLRGRGECLRTSESGQQKIEPALFQIRRGSDRATTAAG